MSIINQALQKAQREQVRHSQQEMPYRLPVQHRRAPRHRWFLLPLGLVAVVGVGVVLYARLLPPTVRMSVGTGAAVTSPPLASPMPPGAPPAAPQFAASLAQTVPEPPRSGPSSVRPVSEAPPSPVALSAESSPIRTALAPATTSASVPLPEEAPATSSTAAVTTPAKPAETLASVAPPAVPAPPESARVQALVQRAVAVQEAGELPRALSLLEQAVKLDPTAKAAYNSLGNVYYQQRRYQQAIAMYQKALSIDPDYAKARNNLGSTYMQLAMDRRAIDEFQKALRADSSYSLAYYNLACVYARSGNRATAAQYLQQAIALEPQARTWAQTDADFAPVRTAPEVQQLLGP
jgi:cytochrome c-type biogenesis protein CcmH/NrfG